MSPPPVFVPAIGVINGFNTIFYCPTGYAPGSLRVWWNGVLMRADLGDGWIELGSGKFQMKEPPAVGDTVSVFYRPL